MSAIYQLIDKWLGNKIKFFYEKHNVTQTERFVAKEFQLATSHKCFGMCRSNIHLYGHKWFIANSFDP